MLKFAPCIEMMFNEVDFYDRFKAIKDAGVDAVDFWGWAHRDTDRIKTLVKDLGMTIASMTADTRDPELAKVFGKKKLLYADDEALDAFYRVSQESIALACDLGAKSLIVTTGDERKDATRYEQHSNIVRILKHVAPLYEKSGITLIVEPLNILCNHMGYYLSSSYEAFGICTEVGSPAVKVLYDIYHQQITEGNLIPTIKKYFDLIGHFHVADNPGRHEPGTGEINYKNVFKVIQQLGYDKYVGLEYSPTIPSSQTLINTIALS